MRSERSDGERVFSAMDALRILLVTVFSVLLFVCLLSMRGEARDAREVRYALRVYGVDPDACMGDPVSVIPVGAQVYNENGTAHLGTVEAVFARAEMRAVVREGGIAFVPMEDRMILEVTVRGEGRARRGDGIRISDVRIAAGSVGTFRLGGYYAARAVITHVALSEEEK